PGAVVLDDRIERVDPVVHLLLIRLGAVRPGVRLGLGRHAVMVIASARCRNDFRRAARRERRADVSARFAHQHIAAAPSEQPSPWITSSAGSPSFRLATTKPHSMTFANVAA